MVVLDSCWSQVRPAPIIKTLTVARRMNGTLKLKVLRWDMGLASSCFVLGWFVSSSVASCL